MNIFFLDYDPKKCAEYHCDKHVVKMIVEYCQIISTAHFLADNNENPTNEIWHRLLKPTHTGNRTIKWVLQSEENYIWLAKTLSFLSLEYTSRYNKVHKYESNGLIIFLNNYVPMNYVFRNNKLSINDFDSLVSQESYVKDDPISSYRNCYMNEKRYMVKYRLANWPVWFI